MSADIGTPAKNHPKLRKKITEKPGRERPHFRYTSFRGTGRMIIQRSERALILAINLSLNVFPSLSLFLFEKSVIPVDRRTTV
jgi:hypothetical protein